MLTVSEFNDILSEVNQIILDHVWDKFPGMFKINPNPLYSFDKRMFEITSPCGTIVFRTIILPNKSVLEVGIEYYKSECIMTKNKNIFNKFVKMFRDA